jgi:DNA adenine methylase
VNENSFVYFDPPYRPITPTACFNSYISKAFDDDEQRKLAEFYGQLDRKKAKTMLSNSDPLNSPSKDRFFDDLYSPYTIHRVKVSRAIGAQSATRIQVSEIVVTNY